MRFSLGLLFSPLENPSTLTAPPHRMCLPKPLSAFCSPPDTFKYHNIYIGDPELQAILRVRPHQYKVQWENNLFYYAAANCPMLQTI